MSHSENQVTSGDHSHHEKPHYDDVNAPVLAVLAVITAVVVFAIVASVQGFFNQMDNQKYYDNSFKTMGSKFVADEQAALTNGSGERGITKIEESMKKVVKEAGGSWVKAQAHTHSHGGASHTHGPEKPAKKENAH